MGTFDLKEGEEARVFRCHTLPRRALRCLSVACVPVQFSERERGTRIRRARGATHPQWQLQGMPREKNTTTRHCRCCWQQLETRVKLENFAGSQKMSTLQCGAIKCLQGKAKAVLLEEITLVTRVSHGVTPSHAALPQHQSDLALVAREQRGYQTNPNKLLY